MIYDAIVVGSGPGGAMAAGELRRTGRSVLLLEKSHHPRHKSCGGGLSWRIHQVLDSGFQRVVEEEIDTIRFAFANREEFVVPAHRPVAYMVKREIFDQYLVRRATERGAALREGEAVVSVSEQSDEVRVATDRTTYRARYVIGADGANSIVARTLRGSGVRKVGFSLESEVRLADGASGMHREVLIELGHIPFGYAWIFPKTGLLSFGMAGFVGKSDRPKEMYHRFLQGQKPATDGEMGGVLGCPIPLYHRAIPPVGARRLAVVGDAAQLVDPLFGEGIFYALYSGRMAAHYVSEALEGRVPGLSAYARRIERDLFPEFNWAYWMAKSVYAFPHFTFRVFRKHPEIIRLYCHVLRGEMSYRELARALHRKFWGYLFKGMGRRLRILST